MGSQGNNQAEIARTLHVGESTVSRDLLYLQNQARENIRKYIDERLPCEYEKCLVGLTSILKEAWITAAKTEDKREKLQALSLAKECYSMKLELLTNATVVDDAIRFVAEKPKEKLKLPSCAHNGESKEPDYGEKGEEEQEKEKESGEIITTTTNQVFLKIN
jgi:hypothetical protein